MEGFEIFLETELAGLKLCASGCGDDIEGRAKGESQVWGRSRCGLVGVGNTESTANSGERGGSRVNEHATKCRRALVSSCINWGL